jgi:hypothetical protein
MAEISVTATGIDTFEVKVTESRSATRHRVTASAQDLRRLASDHSKEDVIEASFRFLLDREPKESILRTFDLPVIGRYFPEYEQALPSYLGDS